MTEEVLTRAARGLFDKIANSLKNITKNWFSFMRTLIFSRSKLLPDLSTQIITKTVSKMPLR